MLLPLGLQVLSILSLLCTGSRHLPSLRLGLNLLSLAQILGSYSQCPSDSLRQPSRSCYAIQHYNDKNGQLANQKDTTVNHQTVRRIPLKVRYPSTMSRRS